MITNMRSILRWGGLLASGAALVLLAGCSGGGDESGTTAPTGTAAGPGTMAPGGPGGTMTGGPGGTMMGGPGPVGGPPMMGGGGPVGGPPMMGGGQPTQTASAQAPTNTAKPYHRPDPFRPWWDNRPAPPPVLSLIQPVRIAIEDSAKPENQPGIEIKEVPNRRVAGILSGNGVYALLDGPDGQSVVKPGDPVGDYTVAAINPDSVVLKREVKTGQFTQTFTQVVPLTDVGSNMGTRMGAPGGIGGPGRMGGTNMGGGMFPGMPGGRRPGGVGGE